MCVYLDFVLARFLYVIEKRFGNIVMGEVASELMQAGFQQAVADNQLKVLVHLKLNPEKLLKIKIYNLKLLFETLPEINLADFHQAKIEKLKPK